MHRFGHPLHDRQRRLTRSKPLGCLTANRLRNRTLLDQPTEDDLSGFLCEPFRAGSDEPNRGNQAIAEVGVHLEVQLAAVTTHDWFKSFSQTVWGRWHDDFDR